MSPAQHDYAGGASLHDIPHAPQFELEADLAAAVAALRADRDVGPVDLARRGAAVVLAMTAKTHYDRPLQINIEILGLSRALFEARPDSLPLADLASAMARPLPTFYGREEGARMREDLRDRAQDWLAELEGRAERLVEQVVDFSSQRRRVLVIGRGSATIATAIQRAAATGRPIAVECLDPAADLGAFREGDFLLAGSHSVDAESVVVGAGTARLVDLCRGGIPCYAIAGPEKLVPSNHPCAEVRLERGRDAVPLSAWTGFLTGDGVLSPDDVRAAIASVRLESTIL